MNVLVVVNGAAYGNDATCNAIRLDGALAWVYPPPLTAR
jgi:sulfur relay (sulfurtransferase) complex TusBCD TusD component (DsrE family)